MRSLFTIALFTAASVSAIPDLGGIIKGALHKLSQQVHSDDPTQRWPKIHFPDNFQAEYVVYQWYGEAFHQYQGMRMSQYVDSDGNRELINWFSDIDGHGVVNVQSYIDFKTKSMHQKIESQGVCQKSPSPFHITNLKRYMHKFQDFHENILSYIGVTAQPYYQDTHAFCLTTRYPNNKHLFGTLYFDTKTLDLKFITLDDYYPLIISVNLTEKKFTDADFQNVECQNGQVANPFQQFITPMSGIFF
eukprot:403376815